MKQKLPWFLRASDWPASPLISSNQGTWWKMMDHPRWQSNRDDRGDDNGIGRGSGCHSTPAHLRWLGAPNGGFSLFQFGQLGCESRERMRAFQRRLRAGTPSSAEVKRKMIEIEGSGVVIYVGWTWDWKWNVSKLRDPPLNVDRVSKLLRDPVIWLSSALNHITFVWVFLWLLFSIHLKWTLLPCVLLILCLSNLQFSQ